MIQLDSVRPNEWNPNHMTPETRASLVHGLQTDGWVASHALLIWGTDDQGVERNVIIDGEHRWKCARELGMKQGPAVLLNDVSEHKAKALTVSMNSRRGDFDLVELSKLVQEIAPNFADLALELGVHAGILDRMLLDANAMPSLDVFIDDAPEAEQPSGVAPVRDTDMVSMSFELSVADKATVLAAFDHARASSAAVTASEALVEICANYGT